MEKSRSGAARETGSDRAQWSCEVTDRIRVGFLLLDKIFGSREYLIDFDKISEIYWFPLANHKQIYKTLNSSDEF